VEAFFDHPAFAELRAGAKAGNAAGKAEEIALVQDLNGFERMVLGMRIQGWHARNFGWSGKLSDLGTGMIGKEKYGDAHGEEHFFHEILRCAMVSGKGNQVFNM